MLGVVITLFDKRTNISKDTHGRFAACSEKCFFKTKISKNVRLEESPAYKETIFDLRAESPGAVEYKSWQRRSFTVSKRIGLPVALKMRHDAHYVEQLTSFSGAGGGRMIRVDQIRPNPDQPRKSLGDLTELTESIVKGRARTAAVRYVPREECYYIISGERRYHSSRAAGLREVPCIERWRTTQRRWKSR